MPHTSGQLSLSRCAMHTSPFATILRLFPLSPRWKENCRKVECKGENACQLPIRVRLIYRVSRVRAEFPDKMELKISKEKVDRHVEEDGLDLSQ